MIETYEGNTSTEILRKIYRKILKKELEVVPTHWVNIYCISTNRTLRNKSYYKIFKMFEDKY